MSNLQISPEELREKMVEFEKRFEAHPKSVKGKEFDRMCPLKHRFVDGAYVREIFMPKGTLLTSKIHKLRHPYFIMKGDCSVLTEKGLVRLKAPYHGITEPGTKRVLYIHEDTIWITVHTNPSNTKDLKRIEKRVIAKTFKDCPSIKGSTKSKLKDKLKKGVVKLLNFIEEV